MAIISEVKKQVATLITGAFAFIAALVWRDAIMAWMAPILEAGSRAMSLTIVAIVVTIIAVVATIGIGKILKN